MAIFTAATFDAGANSALDMGTLNISGMFGYNGRTHNSIKEFSPGTDYKLYYKDEATSTEETHFTRFTGTDLSYKFEGGLVPTGTLQTAKVVANDLVLYTITGINMDAGLVYEYSKTDATAGDLVHDGSQTFLTKLLDEADYIGGSKNSDVLRGFTGADVVYGGAKGDNLVGGSHNLTLGASGIVGDGAADTFDYTGLSDSHADDRDVIWDFEATLDKVDLEDIDTNTKQAGDQDFVWAPGGAFTGKRDQAILTANGLEVNLDGDKDADFAIDIKVVSGILSRTDFDL